MDLLRDNVRAVYRKYLSGGVRQRAHLVYLRRCGHGDGRPSSSWALRFLSPSRGGSSSAAH